jgi:hypothetical protein
VRKAKNTGSGGRKPPRPPISRPKPAKTRSTRRSPPFRLLLRGAAQLFAMLSEEYAEATDGYRAKLYVFAQRCYRIGLGYTRYPNEFKKLKEDPFWADVRQKPKDDKKMRAVLVFTIKARSAKHASSITKIAKVLDSMAAQNIKPDEVAKRLKAGGGILKCTPTCPRTEARTDAFPTTSKFSTPSLGRTTRNRRAKLTSRTKLRMKAPSVPAKIKP